MFYADDMADACLFLMQHYDSPEVINIGTNKDHTVRELADLVKDVVGFEGEVLFDTGKPTGMLLKFLDSTKITDLGWKAPTDIQEGLEKAYQWFLEHVAPQMDYC